MFSDPFLFTIYILKSVFWKDNYSIIWVWSMCWILNGNTAEDDRNTHWKHTLKLPAIHRPWPKLRGGICHSNIPFFTENKDQLKEFLLTQYLYSSKNRLSSWIWFEFLFVHVWHFYVKIFVRPYEINISYMMFWCTISLHICTSSAEKRKRYYTPKHLKSSFDWQVYLVNHFHLEK